jgi:hypothetical protein
MQSSVMTFGKFFGVILSGCLMLAAPGCVVMDPADEADYIEAEWADELLDEAEEQGVEDPEFETMESEPSDPNDFPDPFCHQRGTCTTQPNNGSGTNG